MYNSTTLQRRSPLAIAVALALGSFLAACGGSDTPASSNDTIAPARIVSVVAATGKAVAGSVISVYDANKDKVGASAADASGKVNIAISAAAKAGKDSVIIISADASATHQAVITVMEAARRSGLSQITFATQRAEQAGQRP